MKKPSTSLLLLLFGMLLLCGVTADNDVFVKDLKLFVGGYEFVVKGMAYNPVPIGAKDMDEQGNGVCFNDIVSLITCKASQL
jgi:hypothetical protein